MKYLKIYNKKTRQYQWQTRFVINGKQIRPKADTEKELKLIVAEIYRAENREKINSNHRTEMEINQYIPPLAELFEKVLKTISHPNQNRRNSPAESSMIFRICCLST